jgi:Glycosyl transferase family 2/Tetratricopeptide repeat
MSLSVCFLTRNEEKNIARALRSVAGVADEVIVADTASRDRTIEIAKEMGAKVLQHEWQEDFAAGRNFTIAQATGDWILWLNADEELLPSCHAHLKACLPLPTVFGYFVMIQNLTEAGRVDQFVQTTDLRLFRRRSDLSFVGRLHPHFQPEFVAAIQGEGKQVLPSSVTIRSYAGLAERSEDKLRWTIRLLELELRDRPGQLHYLIEYGRTLLHLNDLKGHDILAEAVEQILPVRAAPKAPALKVQVLLEYLIGAPPGVSKSKLSKDEALELALRWFPASPPLLFNCAQYCFQKGAFRQAAEILERLIQLGKRGDYDRTQRFNLGLIGDDALVNLALCYRQLGELDKAEQCYRLLLHTSRFHARAIEGLAAIQEQRRPGAASSIAVAGGQPRQRKK